MTRHDRYLCALLLARWGFAALVAIAVLTGLVIALTVSPPSEVPSVALQASPVYRVEVGGAVFAALYVMALAFALSLRNRGFTEIGGAGVRAQDLAAVSEGIANNDVPLEALDEVMDEVRDLNVWREEIENGR